MSDSTARVGKAAAAYGTGRSTSQGNGYVRIWLPGHPLAMSDGYVLEHRLVVHDAGILVPEGCHVHHKNGDKADNRLENLEVLTEADHHAHHVAEAGTVTNQFGVWPLGGGSAHGLRSCYNRGCRCDPCRAAEKRYKDAYLARRRAS